MRFIFALLLISTIFVTHTFSQIRNPLTEKTNRIRANERNQHVKSIRSYAHSVDANGKTSRKGDLLNEVIFNEQGLTEKSRTWANSMLIITEYEYNAQGKPIKDVKKTNGHIVSKTEHEYDNTGKLLENRYYKADGSIAYSEDLRNRPEDDGVTGYNSKGEVTSKTTSRYDSVNHICTLSVFNRAGKLQYEDNYRLDENGNILEWWMIDDTGAKRTSIKFTNDVNGNELESQTFKADGTLKEKNVSTYNEKGLKIENARYDSSDTKIEVMRYEYDYFD